MNNNTNTTNDESSAVRRRTQEHDHLRDAALLIWRALPESLRTPESLKASEEAR